MCGWGVCKLKMYALDHVFMLVPIASYRIFILGESVICKFFIQGGLLPVGTATERACEREAESIRLQLCNRGSCIVG